MYLPAQTYDPEKIVVNVAGMPIVGFSDGTFVKVSKNTENFKQHVGAQGDVDYVKSADESGKISITLKHTSPSNWLLKQLEAKNDVGELFTVELIDVNLNDAAFETMRGCVIEKTPDTERGADITSREWSIMFAKKDDITKTLLGTAPAFTTGKTAVTQPTTLNKI